MPASGAPAAIAAAPSSSDRMRDPGCSLGALADADDVSAGDMAQFVRDHALQLIGIVGRGQQAAVDIDDLPAGDEGVDLGIVDQHDLDVGGVEPGGLDQRARHVAEQQFGLAVAQDRLGGGWLDRGEDQCQADH